MIFFVGLHQPADAQRVSFPAFISVNRIRERVSDFIVEDWIMDGAGFTELSEYGGYRHGVDEYAQQVNRWATCGNLRAAVSQDYMCEPMMVKKTGLSVEEHQKRTIQRYMALRAMTPHYIMPVIQGFTREEYLSHVDQYRGLLEPEAWVGVGSVCKRNKNPAVIEDILGAIKQRRPDLRLHGFGLKTTALVNADICDLLYSADSMAWSYAARKQGRNANDWREAEKFAKGIMDRPKQCSLRLGPL